MADTATYVPESDSDVQGGVYAGCTKFPDIWRGLAAPFAQVKQRVGGRGRQLSYITARQAMNRFDAVVGPENWEDRYYEVHGVLFCEITITLPDGRKISKSDGGGFKEMTEKGQIDQENTDKTGPSDAFKRAAVKFGVARGLYQDGTVDYADDGSTAEPGQSNGVRFANAPGARSPVTQQVGRGTRASAGPGHQAAEVIDRAMDQARRPPAAPPSRAPRPTPPPPDADDRGQEPESPPEPDYGNLPRSINGIYPWAKDMEGKYRGLNLVKALNAWGKPAGLPYKTNEWPETFHDGTEVLPAAIDFAVYQINTFLGIADPVSRPR